MRMVPVGIHEAQIYDSEFATKTNKGQAGGCGSLEPNENGEKTELISIHEPNSTQYVYEGSFSHEACWVLLKEAARPFDIDPHVLRLFSLACPDPHNVFDWGHTYDLYQRIPPWESRYDIRFGDLSNIMIDDTAWQYNPVDIPGITEMEKCCDPLQGRVNVPRITTTSPLRKQDIFGTLPEEIFNIIFVLLPSKDIDEHTGFLRCQGPLYEDQGYDYKGTKPKTLSEYPKQKTNMDNSSSIS
ncbi:hypothetical protein FQN53_004729 [Emmonsiellopsis sp. PD_33]|nr:hypothetical protein FQN53_004729 [Emmonsiellopsis sp. PD_33]